MQVDKDRECKGGEKYSRREFLHKAGRYVLLGGLLALGAVLLAKSRRDGTFSVCGGNGACDQCPAASRCMVRGAGSSDGMNRRTAP